MNATPCSLRVDIPSQTLTWMRGAERRVFPVSTSRQGVGFDEGSLKTPTGRFRVSEKFGDGEPLGAVFRSRVPIGQTAAPGEAPAEDLILTRILWLDGLDPQNANTRERFIYIHGTNREDLIGQPASHGCIRMRNEDVAALYNLTPPGTPVEILA